MPQGHAYYSPFHCYCNSMKCTFYSYRLPKWKANDPCTDNDIFWQLGVYVKNVGYIDMVLFAFLFTVETKKKAVASQLVWITFWRKDSL